MTCPVVAIARQLGSGGEEIAAQVAARLRAPLLDREVISRAAQAAGVTEEALGRAERSSSLLSRMLEGLGKYWPIGADDVALGGFSSVTLLTTSADFRALLEQVLRDVADAGPAVILGHAGQIALRNRPGVLNVFVHAPAEYRAACLARAEHLPLPRARAQVEESDRERVCFFRTAYHVDWYDLRLYDVVVDTQLVGVDGATELIVDLARRACAEVPEAALPREAPAPAPPPALVARPEEGVELITLGDERLRIRPMTPADAGALLALFRSLPREDLLFLRRDVRSELVLDAWAREVADGKIVTLLAETAAGSVVGEASLRPSEVPWTGHVGEVRVIVAPAWRGRGLGRALLQEMMAAAHAAGVEKLVAEMMVEQTGARRLFEALGFREEGRYRAYARDQAGALHDLVVVTATVL